MEKEKCNVREISEIVINVMALKEKIWKQNCQKRVPQHYIEKIISLGGKRSCMECCSRKEGSRIAWLPAGVWKVKRIRRNMGKGRWQTL